MSGPHGTEYSSDDIGFLRVIGRVVAFAIDDNFNLRQAEAARAELQRQNEKLQRSERELRDVIETIPSMAGQPRPTVRLNFSIDVGWITPGLQRSKHRGGDGQLRFTQTI
jgi:hypothetical protein